MQTEGDAYRQIQTYRHTNKHTGMQACRQAYMHRSIDADMQTGRQTDIQRQTDRWRWKQLGVQAERERTDKERNIHIWRD